MRDQKTNLFISLSDDYDIAIGSCMAVRVVALRAGFTTLTVTYQYGDIILKAAATIGSYLPLRVSMSWEKVHFKCLQGFQNVC